MSLLQHRRFPCSHANVSHDCNRILAYIVAPLAPLGVYTAAILAPLYMYTATILAPLYMYTQQPLAPLYKYTRQHSQHRVASLAPTQFSHSFHRLAAASHSMTQALRPTPPPLVDNVAADTDRRLRRAGALGVSAPVGAAGVAHGDGLLHPLRGLRQHLLGRCQRAHGVAAARVGGGVAAARLAREVSRVNQTTPWPPSLLPILMVRYRRNNWKPCYL